MTIQEAIIERHSVRRYTDRPLEGETLAALEAEIAACNAESGLHIQLVREEPRAFDSPMAHYGHFSGVRNYLALVGKKGPALAEACGYYGQRLVLFAQMLGLNTCWVALTFKKIPEAFTVLPGEKLEIVITIGYGATQGHARKTKTAAEVSNETEGSPAWFKAGVAAALLAPTATNQQKFFLTLDGDAVTAKAGLGFYSKVDLGIVKYQFEAGAQRPVTWR